MRSALLSLLLFAFVATSSLFAEEPPAIVHRDKKVHFILWKEFPEPLYARSGDYLLSLENLNSYRRSSPVSYTGPEELELFAGIKPEDYSNTVLGPVKFAEELPGFRMVGSINIPQGQKQPLVMLLPSEQKPTTIRGASFEDHPLDFPFGEYKVFNLSGRPLAVILSGEFHELAPRGVVQIRPPSKDQRILEFKSAYQTEAGQWKMGLESILRYRPNRREIIFLRMASPDSTKMEILNVVEYASLEDSSPDNRNQP